MSVIKFELKQEHIDLLKAMNWSLLSHKFIVSAEQPEEDVSPFGGDDLYEDIDLILNGKPEDFNPLETFEPKKFDNDTKLGWDKLISELPQALEIILSTQGFNLGEYKARFH